MSVSPTHAAEPRSGPHGWHCQPAWDVQGGDLWAARAQPKLAESRAVALATHGVLQPWSCLPRAWNEYCRCQRARDPAVETSFCLTVPGRFSSEQHPLGTGWI